MSQAIRCETLSIPEPSTLDRIQERLLKQAGFLLFLFALALTLAPAARGRDWQSNYPLNHWLGWIAWAGLFTLAHRFTRRYLPQRDPYLIPLSALLSGWGLLTIWRLSPGFGLRQSLWLVVSMTLLILGVRAPGLLSILRRFKYIWLTSGLLLTGLTLFLGTNPMGEGPRLWLELGGLYLQPSEPLKLLLIIYLAAYLADNQLSLQFVSRSTDGVKGINWRDSWRAWLPLLAPTLVMTSLALLLILAQRDLGTASIFIFLYVVVVYIASGSGAILAVGGFVLAAAGIAAYSVFDVVRLRVDAWINPWLDPSGRSYQIVQSLIAIANGGLLGRGPGMGNPGLVPVPHSDFIFSSIMEEMGLAGGVGLLLLLAFLANRGLRAAIHAPEAFQRYLAVGLTAYFVGQSILIIGGNLRLLPLTGVTLPFVSYGGSSLATTFVGLMLLLKISHVARPQNVAVKQGISAYQQLAGFLLLSLAAAGLTAGWWTLQRAPDLLTRTDNARRSISDRYVQRGAILDRQDHPLAQTQGQTGSYVRSTLYPAMGTVLGYNDPVYGQAGMEASLDVYLRGLTGYPAWTAWWENLLYGQPPPGLDVRLSLDLSLQQAADQLLAGHAAAAVLINADTGEILVMASHPSFDPNRIAETWEELIQAKDAPLVNRATMGRYPAMEALGPILLAEARTQGKNLTSIQGELFRRSEATLNCAAELGPQRTLAAAIQAGCPAAVYLLLEALDVQSVQQMIYQTGLEEAPAIRLPAVASVYRQGVLLASPLQVALAAATLNNQGVRPVPILALSVRLPEYGWTILPPLGQARTVYSSNTANNTVHDLASPELSIWQSVQKTTDEQGRSFTWYLAGSLPEWQGSQLTVVVLLEADHPKLAAETGQMLLQLAMQP